MMIILALPRTPRFFVGLICVEASIGWGFTKPLYINDFSEYPKAVVNLAKGWEAGLLMVV
jgi:hypothetical protein